MAKFGAAVRGLALVTFALTSACRNQTDPAAVATYTSTEPVQNSTSAGSSRKSISEGDAGVRSRARVAERELRRKLAAEILEFGGACPTDGVSWPVIVRVKGRKRTALVTLQHLLKAEPPSCSPNGDVEFSVTSETLKQLFGTRIRLNCSVGMGNSFDSESLTASVEPDGYVPAKLAPLVYGVSMDTDPKRELFDDPHIDCKSRFR